MDRKTHHRILQILSILPVWVIGRILAMFGKTSQAMRLVNRHVNSHWWKKLSFMGYEPTAHDVFIVTYAKSGTNWMMQIAQQIAYLGTAEFYHIHHLVPWPDAPFPEIRAKLHDATIAQHSPTGLRIIKTHYERAYVPYNANARYIVVIRDPKEVVVSGYYFGRAMFDAVGAQYNLDQWMATLMEPDAFLFGDWAVHTASWWAMRDRSNVFVVTYGELKREMTTIIQQIAKFIGVQLSSAEFDMVVEKSSFAWMKANDSRFRALMMPQIMKNRKRPLMIRSGSSGKSGELLTSEQQVAVDQLFIGRLQQLGSDFPYAEIFM